MAQKLFKSTNNFFVFGFLIGATIFLSSFLIAHYSLAADDNANESRCLESLADCDNNDTACSYFNFDWTSDGYPGGAGNASCCGDDSQEVYVDTTSVNSNLNTDWQDKIGIDPGCCTNYNRCVVGGQCYSQGSVINSGWTTGNDIYAYCGEPASGGISGTVYDCDYPGEDAYCGDSICGAGSSTTGPTVYAGEADVGEYPDTSTPGCCGDDANENYVSTDCDSNSVSLCCPDDKPYVKNGICVPDCSWVCGDNSYNGTEYDDSQSHCDSVSNFQLNGCGDADSSWNLPAGGSASGNCWQGQCCGDDTGEYVKVYSSCGADNASAYSNCTCESDNPFKSCCDEYTDCAGYITGSTVGQCFNFNQVADISESGHQWICKENNTWEDCDTNYNDCGDTVCGSASGVYAGESGVGMYDNMTTRECCGDDTGEYYAELCPGVTGVERKCCNASGDKIDQNGNCVASCPSTNQAPTINLSSPTNGATCQSQSGVRLSWTANDPDGGPNPLQYYVYHSTDQNLVTSHDASVLVATVSSNYYDISGLNYNTTYYWSVIADDGDLQTASEVWSYTTQACDSSQACCQADGCSFIGDGGQPRGYTDSYSCSGDSGCGGSCDIQMTDYYCQDNDESVHQSSGPTGATCDGCEEWDGSDGCNLCTDNECGANHPCTTSQCDLYDPDGIGPVGTQAYYQTRSANCNNCICSAWGAYESCQDSYNNCTGANRVECYQGTGCNTANNACYCETGYDPDGSGGCISDGTYPIVDFDWCLSAQTNTIQFNSTVTGGTEPYTSYSWDFGDNSCSGSNPAPECDDTDPLHTYPAANIYNVTLVVTDSNSLQGQKTEEVDLDAFNKTCSTPFNFNSVVSQSSSSLVLNWDYSLGNSNYAIYRADNGSGTYNQLSNPNYSCDINTCTYTDTGLQAGTQYSYYIVATASNTYNSTTNPVCDGATQAPCPLSAYTKSDVGDLNVYSDSCGKIKIQWNDLGEDYTYRIYRGLDSASTITSSDFLSSLDRTACSNGTCSYEDSSIIPEKIYYYKVTSYSTATGESSLSDADFGSAFSYCYRAPVWGEK